nr:MAG TPA: hypothetical protein [Bacteriophage sp.]
MLSYPTENVVCVRLTVSALGFTIVKPYFTTL